MSTPAGIGPLALFDLPDPCVLGSDDDVAMFGLAARLFTPPDAPAEWNEPTPVACLDLRAAIGTRLDAASEREWERRANEVLSQDDRCSSVSATLKFAGGVISCEVRAVGARGPFSFVATTDGISASILRGS